MVAKVALLDLCLLLGVLTLGRARVRRLQVASHQKGSVRRASGARAMQGVRAGAGVPWRGPVGEPTGVGVGVGRRCRSPLPARVLSGAPSGAGRGTLTGGRAPGIGDVGKAVSVWAALQVRSWSSKEGLGREGGLGEGAPPPQKGRVCG